MDMLLKLTDIMQNAGLNPKEVKLARHPLSDKHAEICYKNNLMDWELCIQGKDKFAKCKYILNFVGMNGTTGKFLGCYRVDGVSTCQGKKFPENLPFTPDPDNLFYELYKTDIMSEYIDRLIIDWGKSARNWCQNGTTEKEVIAILPKRNAQIVSQLRDFESLRLSFDELETIVSDPDIYSDWLGALSTTYAIYLIVDTVSGLQYVGSAYGKDGLFGRWSEYVKTHHGGNKKIKALLKEDPQRYHAFQFSILQILPKSLASDADTVIQIESLWKDKLLIREFGLNDN